MKTCIHCATVAAIEALTCATCGFGDWKSGGAIGVEAPADMPEASDDAEAVDAADEQPEPAEASDDAEAENPKPSKPPTRRRGK